MNSSLTGRGETEGNGALKSRYMAKLGDLPGQQASFVDYQSSKASRYSEFDDIKSNLAQSTVRSLSLAA